MVRYYQIWKGRMEGKEKEEKGERERRREKSYLREIRKRIY